MSNMKYEQMSKSLRKTNTDFHPYMTLTTEDIPINLDKSASKDEDENKNAEKENLLIDKPKEIPLDLEEKLFQPNEVNKLCDNIEKQHNSLNKEGENEESFHIITEKNENNQNKRIIQLKDDFSNENNEEEANINNQLCNKQDQELNQCYSDNNNGIAHQKQGPSIEIEPIQLNTIPISSKPFQPTLINQRYITEKNYEKKLQNLNQEIQLFQEEKQKILILKEEYENLYQSLNKEINELTIQKNNFEKWKEEEVKRIQAEKKSINKDKKQITGLKTENQTLKSNELGYKNQIEKLLNQIKEFKKEVKNKENVRQLNANPSNNQNISSSSQRKLTHPPNTQRNAPINTTKLLKQQIPKDISFSTPCQSSSISNYNTNIAKKSVPKPIQQNANLSLTNKEDYDLIFPEEHSKKKYELIKEEKMTDGKHIKWFTNNKKEIIFPSGVRKAIYSDGFQIVMFANGDIKQIYKNGKTVYYFKEAKTIQTSFDNGLQVFKFQNGQIEKHFSDGKKEIFFVDGSYRIIRNDGSEETLFSDGTIQKIDCQNVVTIETVSNSKDILISK